MRTPLLALVPALSGCIIAYAPAVQPLGRVVPDTTPGHVDVGMDIDLGRNLTEGAGVNLDGELEAADGAPVWPCWGVNYRQGLGRGLGIEGRINGSLMLPLPPLPVPNGMSMAPVVRVYQWGDSLKLHTIPRFMFIRGHITVAAYDKHVANTTGLGLELPAILSWEPVPVFAATSTLWLRGYHMSQTTEHTPDDGPVVEGVRGSWLNLGSGATLNLFLRPGAFRFGLGAGVEWMPNPGASVGYADSSVEPPGHFWVPQFGLTMGGTWGGEED